MILIWINFANLIFNQVALKVYEHKYNGIIFLKEHRNLHNQLRNQHRQHKEMDQPSHLPQAKPMRRVS